MFNEHFKPKHRAIIATFLILILSIPLSGERVCCEGDTWLHWTGDVQQAFVLAYSFGYSNGFAKGCEIGTKNAPLVPGSGIDRDPTRSCRHQVLDFSKGADYFVKSITDFYKNYPTDRYLYITDLMGALGSGMTLDEIHKNAGPGGVRGVQ